MAQGNPCDALNSRRPQRLRRALRVAGLRARVAVFVVPAAVRFVFASFLLASFRPDAVVTVRLAAERFFARVGLPIDPFAPPFRTVFLLETATLPAPLAAALLATPFLPKLLLERDDIRFARIQHLRSSWRIRLA